MTSSELTIDDVLPNPGFEIDPRITALVVTDPQHDFLSADGVAWDLVGPSVTANDTVAHLEALLRAAQEAGIPVFISPHYYYPNDHKWLFGGALEALMHAVNMFDRRGALSLDGFDGSGADWHAPLKPYIERDDVIVASEHKIYGPQNNDLALQLQKRGIDKVILAGMSANLCVESHMRDLIERGFEVAVVKDATAAAVLPGVDVYGAAVINFRMIASSVPTTEDVVAQLRGVPAHA